MYFISFLQRQVAAGYNHGEVLEGEMEAHPANRCLVPKAMVLLMIPECNDCPRASVSGM